LIVREKRRVNDPFEIFMSQNIWEFYLFRFIFGIVYIYILSKELGWRRIFVWKLDAFFPNFLLFTLWYVRWCTLVL
jgi:hypothetical protein